jgi:hypothetical protein
MVFTQRRLQLISVRSDKPMRPRFSEFGEDSRVALIPKEQRGSRCVDSAIKVDRAQKGTASAKDDMLFAD